MKVDSGYSNSKLALGCLELARHPGRIKERLAHAAGSFVGVNARAMRTPALQQQWADVWSDLTAIQPTGDEGAIGATLAQMNETTAVQLVERILGIEQQQLYPDLD